MMPDAQPAPAPAPPRLALALRRLGDLSPFGPIFGKELRTTARRKRSYLLRVFYLGGLLLALLFAWSVSGSSRMTYGSVAAQVQAQAQLGAVFFMCFAMFSVIAMAAIGPVLTSTAISSERLGKTLPVLLMTPITAWQVVAGKLFSRLLVALTLIGLSLPVLALVRLLGGVEMWQMAGIVCVCAVTALATAAIGLLFSTFMNRAYAVILLSYATLLFLYMFLPFVIIAGIGVRRIATMQVFATFNPFFCAGMLSEPRGFMMRGMFWVPCVLTHLGLTAVLLTLSALALRRIARRAGEQAVTPEPSPAAGAEGGPAPWVLSPIAAVAGETLPSTDAVAVAGAADVDANGAGNGAGAPRLGYGRRPPGRGRDVSDRPVLWREVRRPLMARRWQAVVAMVLVVGMLLLTYAVAYSNDALGEKGTHQAYAVVFNGLLWLLTAVLAATAIAQEKESDTWTLLLTTPLSGRAIVWGKVGGLYRRLVWPAALFAAHLLLFAVAGVIDLPGALLTLWVMFSFNTVWVATGLYLSLRFQKVTFAVIANLMLAVIMYLAAAVGLSIASELGGVRNLPDLVGWYLPYFYIVNGITGSRPFLRNGLLEMPGGWQVGYEQFYLITFGVGAAHLGLSSFILAATAKAFDRIVGRAGDGRSPQGLPPAQPPAAWPPPVATA